LRVRAVTKKSIGKGSNLCHKAWEEIKAVNGLTWEGRFGGAHFSSGFRGAKSKEEKEDRASGIRRTSLRGYFNPTQVGNSSFGGPYKTIAPYGP